MSAIFGNLIEVGAVAFDQVKRRWLEQFDRVDVDVAVGDHGSSQLSVV